MSTATWILIAALALAVAGAPKTTKAPIHPPYDVTDTDDNDPPVDSDEWSKAAGE